MAELNTSHFAAWFEQLWGHGPFPWQTDLVEQVDHDGRWPDLVDLPTGTGKTSLIDIAVFLQALDAGRPMAERWMPRRIVNVVDRRVVVDQAAQRARRIADTLLRPEHATPMASVAERLRSLAGRNDQDDRDPPLLVATLRGAIAKDESWMRRPDVPAILSSTIDQVGSRLLFRGYGISRGMRPIHAGLLGNDVLWLLDEVHLARPFAETLGQVGDLRRRGFDEADLPDRWAVVEMSATPTGNTATRFPATPLEAESHPLIGRRLRARKPVEREEVKVAADATKADEQFATACAKRARALVTGRARTIGVIVNRVDTARLVHQKFQAEGITSHLLTGRMRPVDRDEFWSAHRSRIEAGRSRVTDDGPFVLVATQCIEAGADLDLDAIVTEAAALDALVQRFGRVDRLGDITHAGEPHISVILARSTALKPEADDPVYGEAIRTTWQWLEEQGVDDFGIRQIPEPAHHLRSTLVRNPGRAPVLLPTQLDQLSQTSMAISADPDVSRWLHGDEPTSPDVQVIWRADIDDDLIVRAAGGDEQAGQGLTSRLAACPPASTEAMAVPIGAAWRWLAGEPAPVTDADGIDVTDGPEPTRARRPWVVWERGQATARSFPHHEPVPRHQRLRPGDVVIVPSTHGGLTDGTWDPAGDEPVTDLAAVALHREQRVDVVRFHPALVGGTDAAFPTADQLDAATTSERRTILAEALDAVTTSPLLPEEVVAALRRPPRKTTPSWPIGRPWSKDGERQEASLILWAPTPRNEGTTVLGGGPTIAGLRVDSDATDEASSFTGEATPLDRHEVGVGSWAKAMGQRLGLADVLADDLLLTGQLHDEGKRDRRFQVILHNGDELAAAAADGPLAKSSGRQPSALRRQEIRRQSGYPSGARHELTSLALVDDDLGNAHDPALVAHLIASHHGWCRPFAPPVIDDHPVKIEKDGREPVMSDHGLHAIDAPAPERFWALTESYGWYGLAWLEAILRLGDHRQSESESKGEVS